MAAFPTAEMVTVAYLKTVENVPADKVATTLPADAASWKDSGFVQVTSTGGSPSIDVPLYTPVLQIDCWANNTNSQKPPWGQAGSLAGAVVYGIYRAETPALVLPAGFHGATVHTAHVVSEPRRVPDPEAGFARYQFDISITWSVVPV
jgi:hypothetical protein